MRIGSHDLDARVLVVAEIGNNHEGSLDAAEEMIGQAAAAGADAVKFQTIVPERLVAPDQTERLAQLDRLCLKPSAFPRLKAAADAAGVLFLSTPFDLESASLLVPLVPAFKIASGDNNFFPLLEAVAASGKPVILSTGLADGQEVAAARACLDRAWQARGLAGDLALLHCVASYPAPPEAANLAAIRTLAATGLTVGYSDHTLGIEAAVLSVALGARIVEKHFTLDKNRSAFRDHALSADPAELRAMTARIREAEILLGSGKKRPHPCEAPTATAARRSATAAGDLPAGTRLGPGDILWVRPGGGISPDRAACLDGMILRKPIRRGERLTPDHLEGGEPCAA
jgi:N-acetylneuraminate synthase/N,N'-diacetyllegionaminate synthase